jgi:hypothetical protein
MEIWQFEPGENTACILVDEDRKIKKPECHPLRALSFFQSIAVPFTYQFATVALKMSINI